MSRRLQQFTTFHMLAIAGIAAIATTFAFAQVETPAVPKTNQESAERAQTDRQDSKRQQLQDRQRATEQRESERSRRGELTPNQPSRDVDQDPARQTARPTEGRGAWLGVFLQDNGDQPGARVANVYPASPAARAGLRAGDAIVEVNGEKVTSTPDVIQAIDEMEPRSRVELAIARNGQQLKIPVVLGRRDAFAWNEDQVYGEGQDEFGDQFANFPPYAMQMEHDRRNAEQHQRIEMEIRKLQDEVRKLREVIEQRK